jgi:hypothetical protein
MVWRDSASEVTIPLPRHKPPTAAPAGFVTLALCVPDDDRYIQAIRDVLNLLEWFDFWDESEYWSEESELRAYDAAAAMTLMILTIYNPEFSECP